MVKCGICGGEFKGHGFGSHLKYTHKITMDEYNEKYILTEQDKIYMIKCKICGKLIKPNGIGSHLNRIHNITRDEYHAKYVLTEQDKINMIKCEICGRWVSNYKGLATHLRTHEITSKEYHEKYILTEQERNGMVKCEICSERFTTIRGLANHLRHSENVSRQEYYNMFILKGNIPICKHNDCNNVTNFKNLNKGYYQYCSKQCFYTTLSKSKISKPQLELFELVKSIHPDAVLEHNVSWYSIDIYIPLDNIAIEYDGSYWHMDKLKDQIRQERIEKMIGCKFLRYEDYIPNIEELTEAINGLIQE